MRAPVIFRGDGIIATEISKKKLKMSYAKLKA